MSWIIRSSTTLTSVPRSLNGASRCDSMKRGVPSVPAEREDRGIEALEVADLQDAAAARGDCDQRARLPGRLGDRLLDQHVHAALEAILRDREVQRRRRGDADRIDLAEQLAVIGDRPAAGFGGHLRRAPPRRRSTTATSCDSGSDGVLLRVEPAEVPDADHGGANGLHDGR